MVVPFANNHSRSRTAGGGIAAQVRCVTQPPTSCGSGESQAPSAASARFESDTQPKIPPCALIISNATRWNSGKYEPTQSESTTHS